MEFSFRRVESTAPSLSDGIHPRSEHGSLGITFLVSRFLRVVLTDSRSCDSSVPSPRELRDAVSKVKIVSDRSNRADER